MWPSEAAKNHIAAMQGEMPFPGRERECVTVGDGAVWLKHWLDLAQQRALAEQCRALMNGPAGGYVPTVRGGGKMHVRMVCLGRHWNALTYSYESTRTDYDDAPVAPLPAHWAELASRTAAAAGFTFVPDLCIMNWYDAQGRMGLHQDKDEGRGSIEAGLPVVSISLGDTARFLFGGTRRRDPIQPLVLESGDAFVFGGPSRLRYHGVSRIIPGTAPPELGLDGRFNLTFRRY
jgi:alkylated DNA repair protein (DNA oxidative demethylase)